MKSLLNIIKRINEKLLKSFFSIQGQSIAEFAVITAMMSTFVATAAPRLSNLMEEGKAQKSIQEIDKLLMQAKNFYELTSKLEGRGRLPGQDKFNEFSIVTGYNYKQGSNPEVIIGDLKFQLFTSGSRAWSFSVAEDLKIINSMKSSLKMRVKGTSSRGTITSDTYSLLGFSKAYQKINEACKK